MSPKPEIGQLVQVRKRAFVVTDIQAQGLPTREVTAGCAEHLVRLSSLEDDSLGEEAEVIWVVEPGAAAHEHSSLAEPVGFYYPKVFDALLDLERCGAVLQ